MEALFLQRCLSGLRSTIGNRVWVEAHRRFKSCSLRQRKKIHFCVSFFFCLTNIEQDLRVGATSESEYFARYRKCFNKKDSKTND